MSFLSNLFKRKPGGTVVGNLLRTVASTVTGGILGNGAMMLKQEETPQEADARLLQGVGAGVVAAQQTALQPAITSPDFTPAQNVAVGAGTQLWSQYKGYIIGGFVGLIAIIYLIVKRK